MENVRCIDEGGTLIHSALSIADPGSSRSIASCRLYLTLASLSVSCVPLSGCVNIAISTTVHYAYLRVVK